MGEKQSKRQAEEDAQRDGRSAVDSTRSAVSSVEDAANLEDRVAVVVRNHDSDNQTNCNSRPQWDSDIDIYQSDPSHSAHQSKLSLLVENWFFRLLANVLHWLHLYQCPHRPAQHSCHR